jgi:hypothetical protein
MAECITCGEYTKFKGGLCYLCYKTNNKKNNKSEKSDKIKEYESLDSGLSEKDWNFRYNMIKGRK